MHACYNLFLFFPVRTDTVYLLLLVKPSNPRVWRVDFLSLALQ